jgi:hypothetical protein
MVYVAHLFRDLFVNDTIKPDYFSDFSKEVLPDLPAFKNKTYSLKEIASSLRYCDNLKLKQV